MVNITRGRTDYYCILETDEHTLPTNQFPSCTCCQIVYELWVSVQGAFPRYGPCGYPSIDTPGIPIILGTEPILDYNISKITASIMNILLTLKNNMKITDKVPLDEEVEQFMIIVEEELDEQTIENLNRQIELKKKDENNFNHRDSIVNQLPYENNNDRSRTKEDVKNFFETTETEDNFKV